MSLDKFERLLSTLGPALSVPEGTDPDAITAILSESYDELVGEYRPVIQALPALAAKFAADIAPIATALAKTANDLFDDDALKVEMDRASDLRAARRFRNLQAYTTAGFSHEEAMALTLIDAANANAAVQNFSSKSANMSSSSSS